MALATKVYRVQKGNDTLFRIVAAKGGISGSYINSGSGTSRILKSDGTTFATPITPTVSYQAASDGRWNALFLASDMSQLVVGELYRWEVVINGGSGLLLERERWFEFVEFDE